MKKKQGLSVFRLNGRLLSAIPPERYRLRPGNSVPPAPGDVVGLDQGFTGPNGEPMTLAYRFDSTGAEMYEAELYDSEFEPKASN